MNDLKKVFSCKPCMLLFLGFHLFFITSRLNIVYVPTIQAMVTRKPRQTGMYVIPQPRNKIPRIASTANV